jgi:hypothetical protein
MPVYGLYGLRVATDRPLLGIEPVGIEPVGIEPARDPGEADVEVAMSEGVPLESVLPEPIEWTLRDSFYTYFRLEKGQGASGTYLRLQYADDPHAATFVIGPGGRKVWVGWSEGAPFHDVNTLLQGPVLGRTLRMRGVHVLHAGALSVGGQAFCLVGNKGAGKSTTTTAFGRLGYPVLTDDLAALEMGAGVRVHPGLTRVRLRADAAEQIDGGDGLTPIWSKDYPNQKYYLDLGSEAGAVTEPLPLKAIYVLGRREAGIEPRIEPVAQGAALIELVAYSYASSILSPAQRAAEFATLGTLVAAVPVRHVHRAEGLDALPGICSAILEDFHALAATGARG